MNRPSRRNFLNVGAGTDGAALMTSSRANAAAKSCGLTPPQTPGPFYPGESQFQPENDLTVVLGRPKSAEGKVVYIKGQVIDQQCKPVANANVEIWQACASGRYNNRKDPNPAPIDPNFRYWGETSTNANGEYAFKTIRPGAYPADIEWMRPPHIHFKVSKLGFHELVTQMYFAGDPLNDKDLILQALPELEQNSVLVTFTPSSEGFDPLSLTGTFNMTIRSVR